MRFDIGLKKASSSVTTASIRERSVQARVSASPSSRGVSIYRSMILLAVSTLPPSASMPFKKA